MLVTVQPEFCNSAKRLFYEKKNMVCSTGAIRRSSWPICYCMDNTHAHAHAHTHKHIHTYTTNTHTHAHTHQVNIYTVGIAVNMSLVACNELYNWYVEGCGGLSILFQPLVL